MFVIPKHNAEETHYYALRTTDGETYGLYSLYLNSIQGREDVIEQEWDVRSNEWAPTTDLILGLVNGDTTLLHIPDNEARDLFPEAFKSEQRVGKD